MRMRREIWEVSEEMRMRRFQFIEEFVDLLGDRYPARARARKEVKE